MEHTWLDEYVEPMYWCMDVNIMSGDNDWGDLVFNHLGLSPITLKRKKNK